MVKNIQKAQLKKHYKNMLSKKDMKHKINKILIKWGMLPSNQAINEIVALFKEEIKKDNYLFGKKTGEDIMEQVEEDNKKK